MRKKTYKMWVYHKTEEPKVIDSSQAEKYFADGWADTPAAFFSMTEHGLDMDDPIAVQETGAAIEGVKDRLNAELNLDEMTKKQLRAYADKHLGIELEMKWNRDTMLKEIAKAQALPDFSELNELYGVRFEEMGVLELYEFIPQHFEGVALESNMSRMDLLTAIYGASLAQEGAPETPQDARDLERIRKKYGDINQLQLDALQAFAAEYLPEMEYDKGLTKLGLLDEVLKGIAASDTYPALPKAPETPQDGSGNPFLPKT